MKKTILILTLCLTGCIQKQTIVQVVKPYEGHFYTEADAKTAVEKIHLEKDESVWILSNRTLKRVLKNVD